MVEDGARRELYARDLPAAAPIVDVGHATVAAYEQIIEGAGTVFLNGPLGVYEEAPSEFGTEAIWRAAARSTAYTALGGGDSISAMNKYGLQGDMNYVCTAGGGMVRFLSGEELPVVTALKNASVHHLVTLVGG